MDRKDRPAQAVERVRQTLQERRGIRMTVARICAWNGMDIEAARRALRHLVVEGEVRTRPGRGTRNTMYWLKSDALAEADGKPVVEAPPAHVAQSRTYDFREMPASYVAQHLTPVVREGAGGPAVPGVVINQSAYDRDFQRRPAKHIKIDRR